MLNEVLEAVHSSVGREVLIKVEDIVCERNEERAESWEYSLTPTDARQIMDGIEEIRAYVDSTIRGNYRREESGRLEAATCPVEWLKIGWIDEAGKWKAYLEFSKDGQTMRSEFTGMPALSQVSAAIDGLIRA